MPEVNPSNIENAIEALLTAALKLENNKSIKKPKCTSEFSSEDEAALKRINADFINNLIKSRKKASKMLSNGKKTCGIASVQFKEAIMIAALVRELSSPDFPLGRKRYQKYSYLVLRKAEYNVTQKFLKKPAGPYDHTMRYKGGENIAIKNGYIKMVRKDRFTGFIPADKISAIDEYLPRYNFANSIDWAVEQFRFNTNDELELLATVDYASMELIAIGVQITTNGVRDLIANESDWAPKLKRTVFSIKNIHRALEKLKNYFPEDYLSSSI